MKAAGLKYTRCAVLILAVMMLVILEFGVLPVQQGISSTEQNAVPQSYTLAYPADHTRIFLDWVAAVLLQEQNTSGDPLRRPTLGRILRFFLICVNSALLLVMLAMLRRLSQIKPRCFQIRLRTLPLGSHAPPVAHTT